MKVPLKYSSKLLNTVCLKIMDILYISKDLFIEILQLQYCVYLFKESQSQVRKLQKK